MELLRWFSSSVVAVLLVLSGIAMVVGVYVFAVVVKIALALVFVIGIIAVLIKEFLFSKPSSKE